MREQRAAGEPVGDSATHRGGEQRAPRPGEVECHWSYLEVSHALRGLMGSAGGTRAIEDAGADAVRAAIEGALIPFIDLATGAVVMKNIFRWIGAAKP
jgi:hypothetical protein